MSDPSLNEMMKVSIREFLVSLMQERDRQYDMRFRASETAINAQFKASETAVNAALAAQEKAVTAAFLASEKAIVKAEDAQKDYNNRSNEFRGQLDDQAKTLMPRMESATLFKGYDDKLISMQVAFDKAIDAIITDIKSLRESRSAGAGAQTMRAEVHETNQWVIGITIGIVIAAVQIILHFLPVAK